MVGTTTAQNMKQSRQSHIQLHFHKNKLYVQTDSHIFCNTKSDDRDSSFISEQSDAKRQVVMNLIYSSTLN